MPNASSVPKHPESIAIFDVLKQQLYLSRKAERSLLNRVTLSLNYTIALYSSSTLMKRESLLQNFRFEICHTACYVVLLKAGHVVLLSASEV
jgi:hypothetical protein